MEEDVIIYDILISACEYFALSTILVKTNEVKNVNNQIIIQDYIEILNKYWERAEKETIEDIDVEYEEGSDYYPSIGETPLRYITELSDESGFTLRFDPILIPYCYGDFCELQYPNEALIDSIKELKTKYPDIKYIAYIAFPWSDRRCGDIDIYFLNGGLEEKDILPHVWNVVDSSYTDEDFQEIVTCEAEGLDEDSMNVFFTNLSDAYKNKYISAECFETIMNLTKENIDPDNFEPDYWDDLMTETKETIEEESSK